MSDSSISIVCEKSRYSNNEEKAQEILEWLVANDIVEPTQSDCILGNEYGILLPRVRHLLWKSHNEAEGLKIIRLGE